ncbi:MAG: hypothetical protein AAFN27_14325 [Pseudomonadota bacterium]
MQINDLAVYSRQLFDEYGPKAIALAAARANEADDAGQTEDATTWRKIKSALIELRGPHQG